MQVQIDHPDMFVFKQQSIRRRMSEVYVHYGCDAKEFCFDKFRKIKNGDGTAMAERT